MRKDVRNETRIVLESSYSQLPKHDAKTKAVRFPGCKWKNCLHRLICQLFKQIQGRPNIFHLHQQIRTSSCIAQDLVTHFCIPSMKITHRVCTARVHASSLQFLLVTHLFCSPVHLFLVLNSILSLPSILLSLLFDSPVFSQLIFNQEYSRCDCFLSLFFTFPSFLPSFPDSRMCMCLTRGGRREERENKILWSNRASMVSPPAPLCSLIMRWCRQSTSFSLFRTSLTVASTAQLFSIQIPYSIHRLLILDHRHGGSSVRAPFPQGRHVY